MTTQEIVSKLWNLCNVLRDDGITYHQYVTELTYILFLKMAKETGAESQIPAVYRWDAVKAEEKTPKAKKSRTAKPKKPSIRAQLDAAKKEQSKQPPPREKTKELEV